ncbi:MAG: dihydroorotate dehydrogenase-like protein [Candidatus Sericytochromatia bacterium]
MDLTTNYLGLTLKNPLVSSASPLTENLDNIKKLEEVGISAVVFHSLFEEQIIHESESLHHHITFGSESFVEALSYFPEPQDFHIGIERYLNNLSKAKESVSIPIIASLNCKSLGSWIEFATEIEKTGVDALELNIYNIPTDFNVSNLDIENSYINIVKEIKSKVNIPVAVKLSPYFNNMAYMGKKLSEAGADALVLFNRFYQPDIDIENLKMKPSLSLSSSIENRLALTWIGILYGNIKADLAATSGIHTTEDVIKLLMAGANVTMMCSALLKNGIPFVKTMLKDLIMWLEHFEYHSVRQMQGSMSKKKGRNALAFEREQYIHTIQTFSMGKF